MSPRNGVEEGKIEMMCHFGVVWEGEMVRVCYAAGFGEFGTGFGAPQQEGWMEFVHVPICWQGLAAGYPCLTRGRVHPLSWLYLHASFDVVGGQGNTKVLV